MAQLETPAKDVKFQIQQLLLTRDPVLQAKDTDGASDEYLDQLTPIIRQSLETNTTDDLLDTLAGLIKLKDREVEAICGGNHNEYMQSVQRLDDVASTAENVKSMTLNLGARILQSGEDLANRKTELENAQRMRINLDATIEAVSSSLDVLNRANKVHQLLKEKSKFEAFKALKELSSGQQLNSDFGFARVINKSVPQLSNIVRSETINDFSRWVSEVDQNNSSIGKQAFLIIESRISEWKELVDKNPDLKRYKFNSPVEQAYRDSGDSGDFSKIDIDLGPLHECVLVHSSLGMSADFQRHFEADRKVRANYLVPAETAIHPAPGGEGSDDISEVESVVQNVAGFFIVDRIVSRRIQSLRSYKAVDDLWESVNQKLTTLMNNLMKNLTEVDTFTSLKKLLGSFLYTMQSFGFNTSGLERVILSLFQRYSLVLQESFKENFYSSLTESKSMPMRVNSYELYDKLTQITWFRMSPEEERNLKFPITLPFTEVYAHFCAEIRNLIGFHQSFLDELQNDPTAIEDILNGAVDELLVNTVCKNFEDRLKLSSREEIIQILINLEYFQNAAISLEDLLSEERISGRRGKVHLSAPLAFAKARKSAEERIFELLITFVDNFLELADYDWHTMVEKEEPSFFLHDMVKYLKTLVTSTFASLPQSVKSFIYLEAFDHLSSALLQSLLEAPNNTTLAAVHNFDVDVRYLENFIEELSETVNDQSLMTTTIELRQSILIMMVDDVEEYNDSAIRMKKYSHLKAPNAKLLAAKVADARLRLKMEKEGISSIPNSPNPNSTRESSPRISSGSKFMKYYRNSVDKLKEGKEERNKG